MPIYEYRCETCDSVFEAMRSMHQADQPIKCVLCETETTIRVISRCYSRNSTVFSNSNSRSCKGCQNNSCSNCH